MLVITDPSKLEQYGFRPNGYTNHSGRTIYVLDFYVQDYEECSLIVNPNEYVEHENEIEFILNVEVGRQDFKRDFSEHGHYSREHLLPLDVIYEMIKDGVLIKIDSKKEVA